MRRYVVLLLLIALGACAEAPFVDRGSLITLQKQGDLQRRRGQFSICYNDGDIEKVWALARETCARYGFVPLVNVATRYQCRLSAPHQQSFLCADLKMRFADGFYVNPFISAEVTRWRREQGGLPGVIAPISPLFLAPPEAPPAMPAPAPAMNDVPPPLEWSTETPPVGGWGQAWDGTDSP